MSEHCVTHAVRDRGDPPTSGFDITEQMVSAHPATRELGGEPVVEQLLAQMRADVDCVPAEFRDWWLAYLGTHGGHFVELVARLKRCEGLCRVLDVGNFPGHFTILLHELGYDVAGIDLAPERAGALWSRHGVAEHRVDVEVQTFPAASDSYDAVILAEVLEHLRVNPLHALLECHRVVRPGGWLLLSVPNVSPRHRIRFLLGRDYQGDIIAEFRNLETIGHMGHFRLYSQTEVRRMLEYVGFSVASMEIAGWLPGGRWRFVRAFGPFAQSFRSHLYALAQKPLRPALGGTEFAPSRQRK